MNKAIFTDSKGNEIRLSSVMQADQEVKFKNFSAKYVVSGNENYKQQGIEGNMLEDKPEDILAHELVGHAIPKTVGSDTGNAVDNENKVRKEVKKAGQTTPSPLRKAAPSHGE